MNQKEEVKLTHSGIYRAEGKRHVSVRFERGNDAAEGTIPACKITKNEGFSQEEVEGLENYLEQNSDAIFEKAKGINNIKNLF